MTIGITSISPRLVPQARTAPRPVGTRSILNPASVVVPAARVAERVPSVFDGATVHSGPGDIFGAGVPDVPSSDRPRRIGMRGFGDVSASLTLDAGGLSAQAYSSSACGIGKPVYSPPDDRASMPQAIANEVYKWDLMVLNRPESDRCDVEAYANDRRALYASLATKWNSLSVSQRDQATKDAMAVAANPPTDTTAAWVSWAPGAAASSGGLLQKLADAVRAATSAAQDEATRQANALMQQAQAARNAQAQATAQGTSIAAQQTATAIKNASLLAAARSGSGTSRDATLPVGTTKSSTLLIGGLAAAAVLGGVLYFTLGKKKGGATPNRRGSFRPNTNIASFIRPGDKVTIVNRFGQRSTGRAVMRGPYGWVLNMGGRHGTPAVASDENIVGVKPTKKRTYL